MNAKQATSCTIYGKKENQYLELVRQFPLRPLRTYRDLNLAVEVIDKLLDRSKITLPEQDYLEVLSDLVESYEEKMVPIRPVGDADLLRFLIEQRKVCQIKVSKDAKIAASTISEVLNGKRKLNRAQIVKLSHYFHINPSAFFQKEKSCKK